LNLNVQAIVDSLAQNNELFNRIAVHPSTNFPGRTQENVLLQLLRKKPEPDVEVYMDKGRQTLANLPVPPDAAMGDESNNMANQDKAKEKALEDVWSQNRDRCGVRIAEYVMNEEGDFYTAEERDMGTENVRTGLRQIFDDDEDESDEEDEEGEGQGRDKDAAAAAAADDVDLMIIDRPPPPPAPAIHTTQTPGTTIDVLMRLATRGQLTG
jgi:mediator of RNA polymerase II transcription subunit 8, fungi type